MSLILFIDSCQYLYVYKSIIKTHYFLFYNYRKLNRLQQKNTDGKVDKKKKKKKKDHKHSKDKKKKKDVSEDSDSADGTMTCYLRRK